MHEIRMHTPSKIFLLEVIWEFFLYEIIYLVEYLLITSYDYRVVKYIE